MPTESPLTQVNLLGVNVAAIDLATTCAVIGGWLARRDRHYVCVRDVHGLMLCRGDDAYRRLHNRAGLVVPDGMPLVWAARLRGHRHAGRVSGADLMMALCRAGAADGRRHFFLGGAPGVAEKLAARLRETVPGLRIVGAVGPPIWPWPPAEDRRLVRMINDSGADVVWIGLGSPKQEQWMAANRDRLDPSVLIGVGAAFDFLAGTKRRAPLWMRRVGLEWLHRLISEPRRLWRRYLLVTPRFVPLAVLQALGLGHYPVDG